EGTSNPIPHFSFHMKSEKYKAAYTLFVIRSLKQEVVREDSNGPLRNILYHCGHDSKRVLISLSKHGDERAENSNEAFSGGRG
ncbi:hypothetical protein HispidOSU_031725, partial [Sigmodon hispidus]